MLSILLKSKLSGILFWSNYFEHLYLEKSNSLLLILGKMLFRDILLNYVDVETLRNLIKYTAVEKWAIENQHIKNFIIYFF